MEAIDRLCSVGFAGSARPGRPLFASRTASPQLRQGVVWRGGSRDGLTTSNLMGRATGPHRWSGSTFTHASVAPAEPAGSNRPGTVNSRRAWRGDRHLMLDSFRGRSSADGWDGSLREPSGGSVTADAAIAASCQPLALCGEPVTRSNSVDLLPELFYGGMVVTWEVGRPRYSGRRRFILEVAVGSTRFVLEALSGYRMLGTTTGGR